MSASPAASRSAQYEENVLWVRTDPTRGGVLNIDNVAFVNYSQEHKENRYSMFLSGAVAAFNAFASSPGFLSLGMSVTRSLAEELGLRFLVPFEQHLRSNGDDVERRLRAIIDQLDISIIPHACPDAKHNGIGHTWKEHAH